MDYVEAGRGLVVAVCAQGTGMLVSSPFIARAYWITENQELSLVSHRLSLHPQLSGGTPSQYIEPTHSAVLSFGIPQSFRLSINCS